MEVIDGLKRYAGTDSLDLDDVCGMGSVEVIKQMECPCCDKTYAFGEHDSTECYASSASFTDKVLSDPLCAVNPDLDRGPNPCGSCVYFGSHGHKGLTGTCVYFNEHPMPASVGDVNFMVMSTKNDMCACYEEKSDE